MFAETGQLAAATARGDADGVWEAGVEVLSIALALVRLEKLGAKVSCTAPVDAEGTVSALG
jgi:hypothetical protein